MRVLLGVVAVLILLALGLGAWVFTGGHKVAVADPDPKPVRWITDTAMRQSVRIHAKGIEVPSLVEPLLAEEGARHFERHCQQCHGAPGVPPAAFARAMQPLPADLAKTARDWSSAQLFWITRHGLKMSGMPAWSEVLVDGEIWALVAFMGQLPDMPADRYRQIVAPPPPPEPEKLPEAEQSVPPPEMEEAPTPSPEAAPAPPG